MSDSITKVVSPKGEFSWVNIQGEGVENLSGAMQYKCDLILSPKTNPKHQAFLDNIDAFWEENKPAGFKKNPKSLGKYFCDPLLDADKNHIEDDEGKKQYNPEGRVAISFKTSTTWPDGKTKKVKTRNSKGSIVELGEIMIGNGSEGYVAGAMDMYTVKLKGKVIDAGVTFYLDELKITKLEEYKGTNNFEDDTDEEDGWTGEDQDAFVDTEEKVRL